MKPVQSERREQERIDGELVRQGIVAAERKALKKWLAELPGPWYEAMEATIFTGWEYDFLKPQALELKVSPELQVGVEKGRIRGGADPGKEEFAEGGGAGLVGINGHKAGNVL